SAQIHSPATRAKLALLVREMNSYYSNLIEGHKTFPRDLERARQNDFSKDPKTKENQKLSLAHMEVEDLMDQRLSSGAVAVHSSEFLCWLHREFYQRLPESLQWSETRSGKKYKIRPGGIRDFNVDVGRHIPPTHQSLSQFLLRFEEFYSSKRIYNTNQLIALAAAHHRLAWIHPFGDGNGRVIRLHSHACLRLLRVDSLGLWTLSRGLARAKAKYFELLAGADQRRRNDYDGRGQLSEQALFDFCKFFLETMRDQIEFMDNLLALPTLRERIGSYFAREALHIKKHREELATLVKALVFEGEIHRAQVQTIVNRKETLCREIIKLGIREGVIESPSEKGKLSLSFPAKVLESYFPKLFADLPVDP
ncbi:MAG TPA: Fic family protein, partial [Candidatus Methylacidiphilales bacterium]|nr:Fic family protein [Candidatus Methylacidiphilales bacterium]